MEWSEDLNAAPYQQVVWVTNSVMSPRKVLATRGYSDERGVHPDQSFFTTVYTPDPEGFFPQRAGQLVCPDRWAEVEQAP